jgi:hypothetical protein
VEHGTKGPDFTGFRSILRYYSSSKLAAFFAQKSNSVIDEGQSGVRIMANAPDLRLRRSADAFLRSNKTDIQGS